MRMNSTFKELEKVFQAEGRVSARTLWQSVQVTKKQKKRHCAWCWYVMVEERIRDKLPVGRGLIMWGSIGQGRDFRFKY